MNLSRCSLALVFIAAGVAGGCANQNTGERTESPSASSEPETLVAPKSDARSRAKAHADLASAYYEVGNLGVALEEVRLALAADTTYAPTYNVQGLVNLELRDNAAAEQAFQRGLRLSPNDPDMLHNYGWFLCQTGREDQSIQQFMTAIRNPLYPTPSKSYAAAGRCMLRKNNPQEALVFFDRALKLDPNNTQALLPYAEMMYRRDSFAEAKALTARYLKAAGPSPDGLWLALRIERKLGDRLAENSYAAQLRLRFSGSPEYQALLRGDFEYASK
jgi:type IV pilus assembly protein PilF